MDHQTPSWREKDLEMQKRFAVALNEWLRGDEHSCRLVMDLVYVAHVWDDLVDRDRDRTTEEIGAAFKVCLFDLLANPFYARFINDLRPVMVNAYLGWFASDRTEDRCKRWFLKASIYNIIVQCAYLVGGMAWAEHVAPSIWGFYEEKCNA